MAVATVTLREHLANVPGVRVVALNHHEDDLESFVSPSETVTKDADLVEAGAFLAKGVSLSEASGFTHFLDGAEKRRPVGYARMLPLYLVHTSAALVERRDRQMLEMDGANYESTFDFVVPRNAGITPPPGLEMIDVSVPNEADDMSYRQRVRREISIRRESHEIEVACRFRGGCLLVDGGIGNILDRIPPQSRIVGVVKSHQHRYFSSPDRVQIILDLKAGQRTSVFRRERDPLQGAEADSFYLRLFESPDESPLHGLVRVEIAANDNPDEVSSWLLAERSPLSLPDARYDKMIYPIRLVEQHLKARQPSDVTIRAIQGI